MTGRTNSSSIDSLIGELYELLIAPRDGRPALDPRMALKPDAERGSYFIAAPRPVLQRADMERLCHEGPLAGIAAQLADLPEPLRVQALERIDAIMRLMAEAPPADDATPSTLIYAMH
jgi:hypothetical protein